MRWVGLVLLGLLCAGCGVRVGTAQTLFMVGTGLAGVGDMHNKACVWITGTAGYYRGVTMLIAQGDVTLDECQRQQATVLGPDSQKALPLPPPPPASSP